MLEMMMPNADHLFRDGWNWNTSFAEQYNWNDGCFTLKNGVGASFSPGIWPLGWATCMVIYWIHLFDSPALTRFKDKSTGNPGFWPVLWSLFLGSNPQAGVLNLRRWGFGWSSTRVARNSSSSLALRWCVRFKMLNRCWKQRSCCGCCSNTMFFFVNLPCGLGNRLMICCFMLLARTVRMRSYFCWFTD